MENTKKLNSLNCQAIFLMDYSIILSQQKEIILQSI